MIMTCFFCFENFEFNTIKYGKIIDIQNKTVNVSSVLLINAINTIKKDNKKII